MGLDPAHFAEPELAEHPPRCSIPVPDPCPQPRETYFVCPCDYSSPGFGGVAVAMSRTQQLVGQLRLVRRAVAVNGQPAVPDDVGRAL
jgi:hypothetical protein